MLDDRLVDLHPRVFQGVQAVLGDHHARLLQGRSLQIITLLEENFARIEARAARWSAGA